MFSILDEEELKTDAPIYWKLFVRRQAPAYLREWRKIDEGGSPGFHWWAFLFGPFWLAYRKMWWQLFAFLVFGRLLIVLLWLAEGLFFPYRDVYPSWMDICFEFVPGLLLGLFAYRLYFVHTKTTIKNLEDKYMEPGLSEMISRRGGTSWIMVLLLALVLLLWSVFEFNTLNNGVLFAF